MESASTKERKKCLHSGKGIKAVRIPSTDRVINCSVAGCACQPSAARADTMREGCDCESHSGVTGTCTYTLAHLCEQSKGSVTASRVETPSGIVISSDEIDNAKADTFSPFVSEQTTTNTPPVGPEDFLSHITFEGMEDRINYYKRLCLKYADIFSDKLAAEPAKLSPFVIYANKKQWECSKNRTSVLLQSVRKEREIKRAID